MERIDIKYDHYKDTFSLIKEDEKERNKLFIILSVVIVGLFLLATDPDTIYSVLNEMVSQHLKATVSFGFYTIQTFLWFILLYYTIRYFQVNSGIERKYKYLHLIEEELESKLGSTFSREGKSYLNQYPLVSNIIYWMYTLAFPMTYVIIVGYKVILEWGSVTNKLCIALDSVIAGLIIVMTVAYVCLLHPVKWRRNNITIENIDIE